MFEALNGWLAFFKATRRAADNQEDDAIESVPESKTTEQDDIDYIMQWHDHERKIVTNDHKKDNELGKLLSL